MPAADGVEWQHSDHSGGSQSDVERAEAERSDAGRSDAERAEAKQAEARRPDPERAEAGRAEAGQADAEQADAERSGPAPLSAERRGAERRGRGRGRGAGLRGSGAAGGWRLPLAAWFALTAVLAGLGGAALALLIAHPGHAAAPTVAPVTPAPAYVCHDVQRGGRWYAGQDSTDTPLQVDDHGAPVAELQCLLLRAGFSPGGIDGGFGPLTLAALIGFQKARNLGVDGQVGPQTWGALRR